MSATIISLILFMLLNYTQVSTGIGLSAPIILNQDQDNLVDCIFKIVESSFASKPTIIFGPNTIENNVTNKFHELMTTRLVRHMIPRILDEDFVKTDPKYGQDRYILYIRYFNDCEEILNMPLDDIDDTARYLVIILNPSKKNCGVTLEDIGKRLSKFEITFITRSKFVNDYNIATFIPQINATSCITQLDVPATFLSTCSSKKNFTAFPLKKPQDLMKCPFKIGIASLYPYTKIKHKNSLRTLQPIHEKKRGSDFEILRILAKSFNFTPEYYFVRRNEENAFFDKDFVKFLVNGSLDACAGGLYRVYGDVVDYSGVYNKQGIMWIYTVKRIPRSWQNFIVKVNGLYIFITCYLCYTVVWYFFGKYDRQAISMSDIMFYSLGALIGTATLQKAVTLKQKILSSVYLILCIYLAAYVSIQMYSFLTITSPPKTYKTNTQLMESGLKPYLIPKSKYFVEDKSYEAFANTSGECKTYTNCVETIFKYNGVTILIDGLFKMFQARTVVNEEARTLKVSDNVITSYHEMLLRKNGTINVKLKKIVERLGEAGISDRLYKEAIGIGTLAKANKAERNILSFSYNCQGHCSITLKQAAGAFYFWCFGCFLSLCTFLVELFLKKAGGQNNLKANRSFCA